MKSRRIHRDPVTFVIIFDKEDEFTEGILHFAREEGLTASSFSGIGAFSEAVLGYFDRDRKEYLRVPVREQVEVLSLLGDIAMKENDPQAHAHGVLGKRDGSTTGGHILEARIWPTLEVVLTETPSHLRRLKDNETGLFLIDPEAESPEAGKVSGWKNHQVYTEKRRI